jgi:hypothetical protein
MNDGAADAGQARGDTIRVARYNPSSVDSFSV